MEHRNRRCNDMAENCNECSIAWIRGSDYAEISAYNGSTLKNRIIIDIMDNIKGGVKMVCSYSCDDYVIGNYSTKAKAMKVLDMIQEAYVFLRGEVDGEINT